MGFRKETKKFWQEHPFLSISFGVSAAYIVSRLYSASVAPEGEFWMVPSVGSAPASLGMTTSTSTTTSSSHIPAIRDGSAGEPSMDMPVTFMGVPNAVKRRIAHGEDLGTEISYEATHQMASEKIDEVSNMADIMGIAGTDMGGHGWM